MILRNPHRLPLLLRFAPASLPLRLPGRWSTARLLSTNALPAWLSGPLAGRVYLRVLDRSHHWRGGVLRQSGLAQHWRFLVLAALLSYATAWMGTRAVMAGFESTWTGVALEATRHENQALRTRQEALREATEAALAAAAGHSAVTPARYR